MNIDVLSLGEILIDFATESVDETGYPTMSAHPGGAPANFLAVNQKYGLNTGMIGKVGTDAFGKMLINTLEDAGIYTGGVIKDDKVFTTLAFVTFDAHGDRSFSFARKPGADTCISPDEIDYSLIDACRVFHFGTLSLTDHPAIEATKKAVEYAKQKGKLISYDPNLRKPLWHSEEQAREAMLWGLEQADIVKISDEEVEFLFGLAPKEGLDYIFEKYDVKLLFVTCGGDGAYYKNANAEGMLPAYEDAHPIDTTGAGDIFGGSALNRVLLSGRDPQSLDDEELKKIVRFATVAAGISTMKKGGISSIPELDEVLDKL